MMEFRSPRSRRGSSHMPCHSRRAETASRQSRPSLSSKSQVPARRTQLGSCGLLHLPSRVTHGPCALRLAWGGGVAPACRTTVRWRPGRRSPWDAMAVAVTPYSTQPGALERGIAERRALWSSVFGRAREQAVSGPHGPNVSLCAPTLCHTHISECAMPIPHRITDPGSITAANASCVSRCLQLHSRAPSWRKLAPRAGAHSSASRP